MTHPLLPSSSSKTIYSYLFPSFRHSCWWDYLLNSDVHESPVADPGWFSLLNHCRPVLQLNPKDSPHPWSYWTHFRRCLHGSVGGRSDQRPSRLHTRPSSHGTSWARGISTPVPNPKKNDFYSGRNQQKLDSKGTRGVCPLEGMNSRSTWITWQMKTPLRPIYCFLSYRCRVHP